MDKTSIVKAKAQAILDAYANGTGVSTMPSWLTALINLLLNMLPGLLAGCGILSPAAAVTKMSQLTPWDARYLRFRLRIAALETGAGFVADDLDNFTFAVTDTARGMTADEWTPLLAA